MTGWGWQVDPPKISCLRSFCCHIHIYLNNQIQQGTHDPSMLRGALHWVMVPPPFVQHLILIKEMY